MLRELVLILAAARVTAQYKGYDSSLSSTDQYTGTKGSKGYDTGYKGYKGYKGYDYSDISDINESEYEPVYESEYEPVDSWSSS